MGDLGAFIARAVMIAALVLFVLILWDNRRSITHSVSSGLGQIPRGGVPNRFSVKFNDPERKICNAARKGKVFRCIPPGKTTEYDCYCP